MAKKVSKTEKARRVKELLGELVDLDVKVNIDGDWGGRWHDIVITKGGNIKLVQNCKVYD
jgi:hypothetical protein